MWYFEVYPPKKEKKPHPKLADLWVHRCNVGDSRWKTVTLAVCFFLKMGPTEFRGHHSLFDERFSYGFYCRGSFWHWPPSYPFIFGTSEGPKISFLTTRSGARFLHSLRSLVRITRRKRPGNEILTSAKRSYVRERFWWVQKMLHPQETSKKSWKLKITAFIQAP